MEMDSFLLFQQLEQKGEVLYLMEIDPTLAQSVRKFEGRDTVQILESKGLFPIKLYIQRKLTSVQRIFIVSESINFAILFYTLIENLRPLLEVPYPPEAKPSLKQLRETAQNLPFRVQIRSSESMWCPVCQIEHCDCFATVKKQKLSNQFGCDYSLYLKFQEDCWLPGCLQDPSIIEKFRIHNLVNPNMLNAMQSSSSQSPTQPQITLNDCITLFNKTQHLSQDNAWECQHCKRKVRALKTIQINRAPPILIIQLKRFHIQYSTQADKNEAFVAFPLDFFNPYKNQALLNAMPSLDSVDNDLTHLYECYAVINHYGSLHGGHYTAYVRVKGENWYLFDDTQVSPVTSVSEIVNHNAYMLFYRRKDIALKEKQGVTMEQVMAQVAQTLSKCKEETILKAEQELQFEKQGDEEIKQEVEYQYDSVLTQYLAANIQEQEGKEEECQEDADLQLAKALQAMELSDQI